MTARRATTAARLETPRAWRVARRRSSRTFTPRTRRISRSSSTDTPTRGRAVDSVPATPSAYDAQQRGAAPRTRPCRAACRPGVARGRSFATSSGGATRSWRSAVASRPTSPANPPPRTPVAPTGPDSDTRHDVTDDDTDDTDDGSFANAETPRLRPRRRSRRTANEGVAARVRAACDSAFREATRELVSVFASALLIFQTRFDVSFLERVVVQRARWRWSARRRRTSRARRGERSRRDARGGSARWDAVVALCLSISASAGGTGPNDTKDTHHTTSFGSTQSVLGRSAPGVRALRLPPSSQSSPSRAVRTILRDYGASSARAGGSDHTKTKRRYRLSVGG